MSTPDTICDAPMTRPLPDMTDSPAADHAETADRRETAASTFREMAHELVQYRELLWQMVLRDLRIRYKQAVMGLAWAVFMPILIVGSGFLVKYAMAQMSGEPLAAVIRSRSAALTDACSAGVSR